MHLYNHYQDAESLKKSQALQNALKPREVVSQLDKFIVGQQEAKKAVAIALRNRWRRHQMSDELKNEVSHCFEDLHLRLAIES